MKRKIDFSDLDRIFPRDSPEQKEPQKLLKSIGAGCVFIMVAIIIVVFSIELEDKKNTASSPNNYMRTVERPFREYDGWDIDKHDMLPVSAVVKGNNIDECEQQCKQQPGCVAISYDKINKYCFLKSKITPFRLEPTSTVRIIASYNGGVFSVNQPIIIEKFNEKSYFGLVYLRKYTSQNNCMLACNELAISSCVAATFYIKTNECILFRKIARVMRNPLAVSWVKRNKAPN